MSNQYLSDYSEEFSRMWDELIDWKEREAAENGKIYKILKDANCKKILDVATGTGFHSLGLIRKSFEVESIDGSINMLNVAKKNAQSIGVKLKTRQHDWRAIPKNYHNIFDAVICLGNSFTHLESIEDRVLALKNFHATLKPGGLLLLDQRNYAKMLESKSSNSATGNVYCGASFKINPSKLDEKIATFEYSHKSSSRFTLHMHTLFADQVKAWILAAGFKQHSMGPLLSKDSTENSDNISFILHCATK